MKKKKFKFLTNIFIILIVLSIVLYFSLKDNYDEIITAIINMDYKWITLAIFILIIYRSIISLSHYLIIKQNDKHVSFLRCLQINFIILFFHGVTPFAGGGQPMEVYYLHNEGISVTRSTNITLQNFIIYQISLVLTGIFALVCNQIYGMFPSNHLIKRLVILGFLINLLVLIITFILSFGKKINKFILTKGVHFLVKINLIKDEEKIQSQLQEYLTKFHRNAIYLKKSKRTVITTIILNTIGLLILYSMPYVVAKGLGINITLLSAIVATAYVMIIGSFVPIPGGTGGIEYGFVFFFSYFVQGSIVNAIMLVWRFISYYLGMIIGAIFLAAYRKKEKI